jgi:hypothetical protein
MALRLAWTCEVAARSARRARLTTGQMFVEALSGGNEKHAPTDEDGGAEVEGAVELEIEVASIEESMRAQRPEGNDGFGHKKMPSEAEKAEGDKPEDS